MKQPAEQKPFYLNRNWVIGFVVSMVAVIAYFFLIVQPGKVTNATPTAQATTPQTGQETSAAGADQPDTGWKEGITFTTSAALPSVESA